MEEKEEKTENLTLNGKPISREELEKQKEIAKSQKGVKLEEVAKGQFSMRILG